MPIAMSDEEISKLTDNQLFDKIGVVFEAGLCDEQDPCNWDTTTHRETLDLHRRLVQESNRRLQNELRDDHERLNYLEECKGMPSYSQHSGKWEWAPWSDCPRYNTLREAIDGRRKKGS